MVSNTKLMRSMQDYKGAECEFRHDYVRVKCAYSHHNHWRQYTFTDPISSLFPFTSKELKIITGEAQHCIPVLPL